MKVLFGPKIDYDRCTECRAAVRRFMEPTRGSEGSFNQSCCGCICNVQKL
jgi:hypothetical protein